MRGKTSHASGLGMILGSGLSSCPNTSMSDLTLALDNLQLLLTPPLPGMRKRNEMLTQVYKVVRALADQAGVPSIKVETPVDTSGGNDLDLPFLE